jgi:adenine-specific DNA-methyltransferase
MELVKRLETMDLDINRVVAYPYSIDFSVMHELKKNIKNLRNNKSVEVIERY